MTLNKIQAFSSINLAAISKFSSTHNPVAALFLHPPFSNAKVSLTLGRSLRSDVISVVNFVVMQKRNETRLILVRTRTIDREEKFLPNARRRRLPVARLKDVIGTFSSAVSIARHRYRRLSEAQPLRGGRNLREGRRRRTKAKRK